MTRPFIGALLAAALVCAALLTGMSHAAEPGLDLCISKGRLAASMTYAVSDGVDLDAVEVTSAIAPTTAAQRAEFDAFVADVRGDVRALLAGATPPPGDELFAERIGRTVMESCAVDYGAKRGYFKRVAIDEDRARAAFDGSVQDALDRAGAAFRRAGSAPDQAVACRDLAFDIHKIASAIQHGIPHEQLVALAQASPELSPARRAVILEMIDEAYAGGMPLGTWARSRYTNCVEPD